MPELYDQEAAPSTVTVNVHVDKAALSTDARNDLKDSDFALPGRRYPIHDEAHARNALARGAQHATPEELATIRRKVAAKYPGIKVGKAEDVEVEVPIWKDDTRQIVYGVALTPGVRDSQGDIIDAADIESAAHKFLIDYRKHDVQHDEISGAAETVESYIAPDDMEIAGQQVLKGSWVMGIHVKDAETWGRVMKGEITGLSIGGAGVRHPD